MMGEHDTFSIVFPFFFWLFASGSALGRRDGWTRGAEWDIHKETLKCAS